MIRRVKKAFPSASIILNRGFEILPQVHADINAVAFESLFRGWDQASRRYTEVTEQDRFTLAEKAHSIGKDYGLPVIAIDYAPAEDRALMRSTAERIKSMGIIPWVTTPGLDGIGIGPVEPEPRAILMLYDGDEGELSSLSIHRNADPIVTYLGFVPEYRNIRMGPPDFPTAGRYAGILCWLSPGHRPVRAEMNTWLVSQAAQGMKITFWGDLPFSLPSPHADAFGLKTPFAARRDTSATLLFADTVMRFEVAPVPDLRSFRAMTFPKGEVLLRIRGNLGDTMDAAAYAPWGGYALSPFVTRNLPMRDLERWGLHPMEFLRRSLRLKTLPAPDVTTENGLRLLMIHVDGDGFANQAEWVPNTAPN